MRFDPEGEEAFFATRAERNTLAEREAIVGPAPSRPEPELVTLSPRLLLGTGD